MKKLFNAKLLSKHMKANKRIMKEYYFIFLTRYNSFIEDGELDVKDGCLASSTRNINLHNLICSLLGEEMLPPFCQ